MDVVEALARSGGVADTRRLVAVTSRRRVATAVDAGRIVRDAHGRYALPTADEARRAANRLDGVVTGPSALPPTAGRPSSRRLGPTSRSPPSDA